MARTCKRTLSLSEEVDRVLASKSNMSAYVCELVMKDVQGGELNEIKTMIKELMNRQPVFNISTVSAPTIPVQQPQQQPEQKQEQPKFNKASILNGLL